MKKVIELSSHEAEVLDFTKIASETAAPAKEEQKKAAPKAKDAKPTGGAAAEDIHKLGIEYTRA